MKRLFFILGVLTIDTAFAFTSDLSAKLTRTDAYLIPAKVQSCANKVQEHKGDTPELDVDGSYFRFQDLSLEWKHPADTAHITSIYVKVANSDYRCTIENSELMGVFYDFKKDQEWDGTLAPQSTKVSQCPITCGDFSVSENEEPFILGGTMTVQGFQRSPSGFEKPLKIETPIWVYHE